MNLFSRLFSRRWRALKDEARLKLESAHQAKEDEDWTLATSEYLRARMLIGRAIAIAPESQRFRLLELAEGVSRNVSACAEREADSMFHAADEATKAERAKEVLKITVVP